MQNCRIHHSVVGLRSCVSEGAAIEDSLLMGADYYEVPEGMKEEMMCLCGRYSVLKDAFLFCLAF